MTSADDGRAASGGPVLIARGDLFWIASEASRGAIPHPHLVLQEDVFNRSRIPTIIVCALTSNLGRANEPGNVLLDPGEGDLSRRSVIVVSQVEAVERARFGPRIGALSARRVEEALAGLRFQQASFFARALSR